MFIAVRRWKLRRELRRLATSSGDLERLREVEKELAAITPPRDYYNQFGL